MADFGDFNFKLLVIDVLMYQKGLLAPKFDIGERLRQRGVEDVYSHLSENDLMYTMLDESRAYFEELEISAELLASVETLVADGGLEVYQQTSPFWDGEDHLFEVHSLEDVALLPNLQLVDCLDNGIVTVPNAAEILRERGIAIR